MGGPPGPMAGLTQVRPASGTPGEVQIHMVIPSKQGTQVTGQRCQELIDCACMRFVGCILGKEGSQIKPAAPENALFACRMTYSDADCIVVWLLPVANQCKGNTSSSSAI